MNPSGKQASLPFFIGEDAESYDTEFKTCSKGRMSKDVESTLSAFSNTEGGRLVLGVDPDGKSAKLNRDELDKLQLDLVSLCRNNFNIVIDPNVVNAGDKIIAYIGPVAAQLRPVYMKRKGMQKGTYVRQGSADVLASDEMLRRMSVAAQGGAETLSYSGVNYKEVFDLDFIDQYIEAINKAKANVYQGFERQEVLIKLKAITKSLEPTMFGLLAFSKSSCLQETTAPTINVCLTQYPGHTKVDESDLNKTYIDSKEFDGNAQGQFEGAFTYIKTKLPVAGTVGSEGKRKDYLIIPEVALREALANCIAHRDYSSTATRIQIDVFSDRIEIINPGTSLVPIEELDNAPSSARNPLLMSFLKELGITDQRARGIRTIKLSLKEAGLLEPKFENINGSFRVTLFSTAFLSNDDQVWLQKFKVFGLNERQLNALAHIRNTPTGITNSVYREINSMREVRDDKKANKDLKEMVEIGLLSPVGQNKYRSYIMNPKHVE